MLPGDDLTLDLGSHTRIAEAEMSNDEILMTNQCPNDPMTKLGHSSFVINSSFVLGHWSFFLISRLHPVLDGLTQFLLDRFFQVGIQDFRADLIGHVETVDGRALLRGYFGEMDVDAQRRQRP